jgi:hypothetical protein
VTVTRAALAVVVAACSAAPVAVPVVHAPAPPAAPAAAAPDEVEVQIPHGATDDLPHRRQLLAPWLRADCVPPHDLADPADDHDQIELALDVLDDQLVACAQMLTRRGGSVFGDHVSYACWNVSATGAVARRGDLGRSYFRCQDGSCPPGTLDHDVPSYDGTQLISLDLRGNLTRYTREADGSRGALVGTIHAKQLELDGSDDRTGADLVAMPGGAIAVTDDIDDTLVFNSHGILEARVEAARLDVEDATHLFATRDALHGAVVDLVAQRITKIRLDGCTAAELREEVEQSGPCQTVLAATHLGNVVRWRDQLYAIDGAGRRLLVLDPATFRATASQPLAVCTPP